MFLLFFSLPCLVRGIRFSQHDVKSLLDTAEASLRAAGDRLSLDYTIIRKEKAVGASACHNECRSIACVGHTMVARCWIRLPYIAALLCAQA